MDGTPSAARSRRTPRTWRRCAAEFQAVGIPAEAELAYGDPAREIIKWVQQKGCDLIAMSTHGHRFLADIFLGTTASQVQHNVSVPVLVAEGEVNAASSRGFGAAGGC